MRNADSAWIWMSVVVAFSGCKARNAPPDASSSPESSTSGSSASLAELSPQGVMPLKSKAELRQRSDLAGAAVYRVRCGDDHVGTAFLHASGQVITAAHVARVCPPSSMTLVARANKPIPVAAVTATDDSIDMALLKPAVTQQGGYRIDMSWESEPGIEIGEPVQWWGFPGGYDSDRPLLGIGYYAGWVRYDDGQKRTYVLGPINPGNSGGPLLDYGTGKVIGIIIAKPNPTPVLVRDGIKSLSQNVQTNGVSYSVKINGKTEVWSESQLIATVLERFDKQTHTGIGLATYSTDMIKMLRDHNLDP